MSTKLPCVQVICMCSNEEVFFFSMGYITKIGKTIIDNWNLHLNTRSFSTDLGTHRYRFYVKESPVFINKGPINFQTGENAQDEMPQYH